MQLNTKTKHFVDFTPVEPVADATEDGCRKITYLLTPGKVYNYRTGIEGGTTRAGYFTMSADAAKRPELAFTAAGYDGVPRTSPRPAGQRRLRDR